ncbi:hypothetical protein TH25_02390 [Thalassospira profundimaris]|uniref:Uncharacterized protein n=1 Tax=Thalassospira profundimaris TaxID=502049 RepID=A0A367XL75_9PROT|nr:hypothetical protein TH25_02390 [Thalassospira profundimaris]
MKLKTDPVTGCGWLHQNEILFRFVVNFWKICRPIPANRKAQKPKSTNAVKARQACKREKVNKVLTRLISRQNLNFFARFF